MLLTIGNVTISIDKRIHQDLIVALSERSVKLAERARGHEGEQDCGKRADLLTDLCNKIEEAL
jgi:hypothetical protein